MQLCDWPGHNCDCLYTDSIGSDEFVFNTFYTCSLSYNLCVGSYGYKLHTP